LDPDGFRSWQFFVAVQKSVINSNMQLWNFEGSFVVFACLAPVDSSIARPSVPAKPERQPAGLDETMPC
jgi:hypothetical protein